MARPDFDPRQLAGSAIAFGVAALLLFAAVQFSSTWLDERAADYRRARAELQSAARQYRSASDDQAVYQEYADRFRAMIERGWIGPEQRLSWIESLQQVNTELKLPVLRYQIERQRAVTLNGAGFDTSHLRLQRTPMRLTIGALHEGDVVDLLNGLAGSGRGLMTTEHCSLQRSNDTGEVRFEARRANVDVECAVDWYTLEIEPEEGPS